MISAALVRAYATLLAANWSRSNFCLDMFRSRRLRNISDASSESETQSTIASVSSLHLKIEQFRHKDEKPTFCPSETVSVNTSAFVGTNPSTFIADACLISCRALRHL